MRILLLFILPILLFSRDFSVASYNVENLFDNTLQGSEYKEYIPNTHNWNNETAQTKLNHTAEVICDINSDIIGLEEIENSNVLNELQGLLKKVGCEYKYSAITTKQGASIQVALLSKIPIASKKELQVSKSSRIRNILEVTFEIDSHPFVIFVNHWKSKAENGKESYRVEAAKVLENAIMHLANREYIVIGDLNTPYDAPTNLENIFNDTNGVSAIGDVLQTYKDGKPIQKTMIIKLPLGYNYNLWNELPFAKRWSHVFKGERRAIDHIIVSPALFDKKGLEYKDGSFMVFAPQYLLDKYGKPNSWKIKNGTGMGYSDHLPLKAYFTTEPFVLKNIPTFVTVQKPIEYLYSVDALSGSVVLKNATVIWKYKSSAVIKQSPQGRGVMLYGCANSLKVGNSYDLIAHEIKSYKGLKEITSISVQKQNVGTNIALYYKGFKDLYTKLSQNEVIRNVTFFYANNKAFYGNRYLPIFFKDKTLNIPDGAKIMILYGVLGYYNGNIELVIYDKNDIRVLEE